MERKYYLYGQETELEKILKHLKDKLMYDGDTTRWSKLQIDFEENKLKVFTGFNKEKSKEDKMFTTTIEDIKEQNEFLKDKSYRYYGIKLIKEYDLYNLPSKEKFLEDLENIGEE